MAKTPHGTSAPRLAEGVELIGEYTGSGFKEPPYIARRADGQVVQIGKLFYVVAEELDGEATYDEIAARASERARRELDAETAQYIVDEKLRPIGLIATDGAPAPELRKVDPLLALKFRVGVVPERVVNRIAAVLRPLFLPPAVACVLAALLGLDVWLFGFHGIAQSLRETLYKPAFILLALGLVILSAAFHECGHATACRYGGARPGKMGVGLYLVWPAFYTDVTDAYRLGKGGRLRTDLGGVYFNAIFVVLTAAAYFATGFEPLLLLIPIQHAEMLHQFLPFVRLDGYYIVSDLAGVPDMFQRIGPTLRSLLPWRRPEPAVAELKRWVRVAVGAYVLTIVPLLLFVLAITVINLPRVLATSWDSGALEVHKIHDAAANGSLPAAVADSLQLAVLVLVPAGLLLTLAQLARRVAGRAWRTTDNRPTARATLVLGAAGAAAFAVYALLPASVYEPIRPGERGTLFGALDQLAAITTGRPAVAPDHGPELGETRTGGSRANSGPRLGRSPGLSTPARGGSTPARGGSGSRGTPAVTSGGTVTAPRVTVSTPVVTATTPAVTVTTPALPLPTVTTPPLPIPTISTPSLP